MKTDGAEEEMAASGEHAVDDADIEERVNALLVGAIDMHCHSGPSISVTST